MPSAPAPAILTYPFIGPLLIFPKIVVVKNAEDVVTVFESFVALAIPVPFAPAFSINICRDPNANPVLLLLFN